MTDFNPEVPAHVQHQNHVQNGVRVIAGTNWDLSRSAVGTPIQALPDPVPVKASTVIEEAPLTTKSEVAKAAMEVSFGLNSGQLTFSAQKALNSLKSGGAVQIVAHADSYEKSPTAVANKRVAAVKTYLLKRGVEVRSAVSKADTEPKSSDVASGRANRRVEVFRDTIR